MVTSSRDTFRTSAFGPAMMTWHSGPARQFILTYFYSIQDIKRQVGKTPPISILMSGKTFYRLWQTINWLWSGNWNINNIQPGRLAGSQLLFAQTERERERERPRDLRSVADKWCRYPAFNSTLWSQHYFVNTFAGSLMMIINFFFNQPMEKSLFDAIDEEERTFWRKLSSHHYWSTMSRFHQIQPSEKLKTFSWEMFSKIRLY